MSLFVEASQHLSPLATRRALAFLEPCLGILTTSRPWAARRPHTCLQTTAVRTRGALVGIAYTVIKIDEGSFPGLARRYEPQVLRLPRKTW